MIYYRYLHDNQRIDLYGFLPMIKRAVETGEGVTTETEIPLYNRYGEDLYYRPIVTIEEGRIYLSLEWVDGGEERSQRIEILKQESNLVSGSYLYYFLCPFGYRCKQLYYIGGEFRSRRSFKYYYPSQAKSKAQRERSVLSEDEPYRRYGKTHYKGKITPYGKRCKRYEERVEKGEEAALTFIMSLGRNYR